MTSVAMIAGMVPVALARGDGAETRVPMAVTIIGGLVTSTVLTLGIVPVVYSLVDELRNWVWRAVTKREPPEPVGREEVEPVAVPPAQPALD
jgi:HAE1 family hydrophobic/amphiphilic exporter-1